jgi:HEAT repeat protein
LLVLAPLVLLVAWAGLNTWKRATRPDPAGLLRRGSVADGPAAEPAVQALLGTLKEPFDHEGRIRSGIAAWSWDPACSAAKALRRIGACRQVLAALTGMLSDEVPERMSLAAEGLGNLGPGATAAVPSSIKAYDKVLKSEHHVMGQSAIPAALGRIAPNSTSAPDAVAILIRALDSKDNSVRLAALRVRYETSRNARARLNETHVK